MVIFWVMLSPEIIVLDPNRQIVRTVVEGTYDREFQCSFIFKGFFEAVYIFETLNGELVVFVSDL